MTKKYIILFLVAVLGITPMMETSARFHWGPWYGAPLAAGLITVAALPLILRRNDETIYVPQSFYQQYNQVLPVQPSQPPVMVVYVQDPQQPYPQGYVPQTVQSVPQPPYTPSAPSPTPNVIPVS